MNGPRLKPLAVTALSALRWFFMGDIRRSGLVDSLTLIPYDVARQLPPLDATADDPAPIAYVKLFVPETTWAWHLTEFDGDDILAGFTVGFPDDGHWGQFNFSEVRSVRGPSGTRVERDPDWKPTRIPRNL